MKKFFLLLFLCTPLLAMQEQQHKDQTNQKAIYRQVYLNPFSKAREITPPEDKYLQQYIAALFAKNPDLARKNCVITITSPHAVCNQSSSDLPEITIMDISSLMPIPNKIISKL